MSSGFYLSKELWLGIKSRGLKSSMLAISVISVFLCLLTIFLLSWNMLGMSKDNILYAIFKEKPDKNLPGQLEDLISQEDQVTQIFHASCESVKNCNIPEEVRRALPSQTSPFTYFRIAVKSSPDIPVVEAALKSKTLDQYLIFVNPEKGSLRQALAQSIAAQNVFLLFILIVFAFTVVTVIWVFRVLANEWAPELETLYLSGIALQSLRLPFFFTGILFGCSAGLVTLLLFFLLQLGSFSPDSILRQWLPDLAQPDFLANLFWRLLGLGLLTGTIIGGLSAFGVKLKSN